MNATIKRDLRCGLWILVCAFGLMISGCGGGGGSSGGTTPQPPGPAGTLDPSFGGGGTLTTSVGDYAQAHAIAVQPDGKIVGAGYSFAGGSLHQVMVVRYTSDGRLDTGFGVAGKVLTAPYPGAAEAIGVALQSDGKIVVLGTGSGNGLVRYSNNGTLDSSFGIGGVVVNDPTSDAKWVAIAVQSDNKIVVAEYHATSQQIGALRFNANGSLDGTFGNGGEALVSLPPPYCCTTAASSIAIQPDGKILVGGTHTVPAFGVTVNYSDMARFDANGILDPAFGQGGQIRDVLHQGLVAIALQPDGKILAEVADGVSRFLSDGTPDSVFGAAGTAGGVSGLLALQPNGKIITAKTASIGTASSSRVAFTLSRCGTDGALDTTFGNAGTVVTQIGANNAVDGVAVQLDGRIVVIGYETADPDPAFPTSAIVNVAAARYFGDAVTTSSK